MKSARDDKADMPEGHLLVMFTDITDHMITIWSHLASNPGVAAAARSCDVRRYQDSMREEEVYYFESYVEATTHTGEIFCWSLDITLTSRAGSFRGTLRGKQAMESSMNQNSRILHLKSSMV